MLDQGKLKQATECYRQATLLDPQDAAAFVSLGFALYEQGLHTQAQVQLQHATSRDPNEADAFYLLGAIYRTRKDLEPAIESYSRAITLKPDFAVCRAELCVSLLESGRAEVARGLLVEGIARHPELANFQHMLGVVQRQDNQLEESVSSLRRALAIRPDFAEAHGNLGIALQAKGDIDNAIECYEQAVRLRPDYAEAHSDLGVALDAKGDFEGALRSYARALAIQPDYAEALGNLANTQQKMGNLDTAIQTYRRAIALNPNLATLHSGQGVALQAKGEQVAAAASFKQAISLKDSFAEAHSNLGTVLHALGKIADAIGCHQRALELRPGYAEAHGNLGAALQEQGELDAAVKSFRRALELKPNYRDARTNLLFTLNYHPDKSAEEIFQAYKEYDASVAVPLRGTWRAHGNDRDTARRLRVGYVSPDMRNHSVRFFLEPLMAHHDKSVVEVFAYSELAQEDPMTARFRGYVEHWAPTVGLSDAALAERIRGDKIDILVDLAGHTAGNRLGVFAMKPSPVSVSWLGYGYTTGLSAIDYYLTDEASAPPGCEGLFSEQPWRLQTPSYAYRPAEGMGEVSALPALQRGHVTLGTLTRAVRINHHSIRVWSQILLRLPTARLVVDSKNYQDPGMREALEAKFATHGIARERLELGYHSPPWDVLRGLDIGLDCFPHNSGTTLFETLYMGVPYVTLAGRPSVGRLGSSILQGVGRPEWIARTEQEYIDKVVALASDLSRLAEVRAGLRAQMQSSALMDEVGFARKVEQAYRLMFEAWARRSS